MTHREDYLLVTEMQYGASKLAVRVLDVFIDWLNVRRSGSLLGRLD